jgi:hypothetical protein
MRRGRQARPVIRAFESSTAHGIVRLLRCLRRFEEHHAANASQADPLCRLRPTLRKRKAVSTQGQPRPAARCS